MRARVGRQQRASWKRWAAAKKHDAAAVDCSNNVPNLCTLFTAVWVYMLPLLLLLLCAAAMETSRYRSTPSVPPATAALPACLLACHRPDVTSFPDRRSSLMRHHRRRFVPARKDQGLCCDEPSTALALPFAHRRRLLLFRLLDHLLVGLPDWPDSRRVTLAMPALRLPSPTSDAGRSSQILRIISAPRAPLHALQVPLYRHRRPCKPCPFVLEDNVSCRVAHL